MSARAIASQKHKRATGTSNNVEGSVNGNNGSNGSNGSSAVSIPQALNILEGHVSSLISKMELIDVDNVDVKNKLNGIPPNTTELLTKLVSSISDLEKSYKSNKTELENKLEKQSVHYKTQIDVMNTNIRNLKNDNILLKESLEKQISVLSSKPELVVTDNVSLGEE